MISTGINLGKNPLVTPPPSIVEKGNIAIKEYFGDYEKGTEEWNQVKIITIGDECIGKVNNLLGCIDID